jgi:hypothetical protein
MKGSKTIMYEVDRFRGYEYFNSSKTGKAIRVTGCAGP